MWQLEAQIITSHPFDVDWLSASCLAEDRSALHLIDYSLTISTDAIHPVPMHMQEQDSVYEV